MAVTLSVIIPNYNKKNYIEKCIESVMNQTLLPDKVIIVDDCSSDGSRDVISKLKEKFDIIVPIYLEVNGGVSNARNIGVKLTNTDYVTFLDSDDYYYNPNKLKNEMQLVLAKENMALAYSKTVKVNENGELIGNGLADYRYLSGKVDIALISNYKNFSTLPRDYMMSRSVFLMSEGYNTNRKIYEDFELSMKLACMGVSFWYTGEIGTAYRAVTGGLSDKKKSALMKEFRFLRRKYWKNYPTNIGKIHIMSLSVLQFIRKGLEFIKRRIGMKVDIK